MYGEINPDNYVWICGFLKCKNFFIYVFREMCLVDNMVYSIMFLYTYNCLKFVDSLETQDSIASCTCGWDLLW